MELVNFEVLSVCWYPIGPMNGILTFGWFWWEMDPMGIFNTHPNFKRTYVQRCLQHMKKSNRITSHWFTVQFDWNSLESKSLHCCSKDARGVALIPVESPCHESKDGHKPTCWRTWINIYIYTCWDGSLSVIMDYGNQNPFKRNAKRQWVNTWKRHSFHHRSPIKKLSHVCIDFAWYIAVLFLLHYKKESSRARCLAWWGLNLFNGPC